MRTLYDSSDRRDLPLLLKTTLLQNTVAVSETQAELERRKEEEAYDQMANYMDYDSDEEEEEMMIDDARAQRTSSRVEVVEVESSEEESDEQMEGSYESSTPSYLHSPSLPSLTYPSSTHLTSISYFDNDANFTLSSPSSATRSSYAHDASDSDDDDDVLITPPQPTLFDDFDDDMGEGDFGDVGDEEREALEALELFQRRAC